MATLSALLALYEGNPPVTGGFPLQRPVMGKFDVFFVVSVNKVLNNLEFLVIWDVTAMHCMSM